jgi:hypothetical protein
MSFRRMGFVVHVGHFGEKKLPTIFWSAVLLGICSPRLKEHYYAYVGDVSSGM